MPMGIMIWELAMKYYNLSVSILSNDDDDDVDDDDDDDDDDYMCHLPLAR